MKARRDSFLNLFISAHLLQALNTTGRVFIVLAVKTRQFNRTKF